MIDYKKSPHAGGFLLALTFLNCEDHKDIKDFLRVSSDLRGKSLASPSAFTRETKSKS